MKIRMKDGKLPRDRGGEEDYADYDGEGKTGQIAILAG